LHTKDCVQNIEEQIKKKYTMDYCHSTLRV